MNTYSPYALRDLYQAIDLVDRKIAHGRNSKSLESAETQAAYLRKLVTKRTALINSAVVLSNLGVRCDPQFLPRSFIHPVQDEASSGKASPVRSEETKSKKSPHPRQKRS